MHDEATSRLRTAADGGATHAQGASLAASGGPAWLPDVLVTLAACGLVIALLTALLDGAFVLSPAFAPRAAVLGGVTGAAILWFVAMRLAPGAFGPANRLTAARAMAVALLAAFIGETLAPAVAWAVIALAIVLLVLDGVDGHVARASGQVSDFGARFDMETDAALTLVLAVLCWQAGKAGPWILVVGLLRYLFVAASRVAPWLGRPLPYSRRRQTICVLQLAGLLAVLSPLFPVPASSVVGGITLLLLTASFAIDVAWLAARRQAIR